MNYKKAASILLHGVWGALRIVSGVVVVALASYFVLTVVISKPWETVERVPVDPKVCGRMSGVVYEFLRGYVVYWPEYEGKSSWEVGFIENKKGCNANFVSLYMAMSLPELNAVSFHEATSLDFTGAKVGIEPWSHGEVGLRRKLDNYLKNTPENIIAQKVYDKNIGMNFVEGVDRYSRGGKQDFFWVEEDGHMRYVAYCVKGYWGQDSFCELKYLLPGADILVSLKILRGRLSEWRNIVALVNGFLLSAEKKEGIK
ncbi:hypothetical protein [Pseudomonas sp. LFS044]|uniref:hypothetical protein n=1 Tax=Pseudomonas sp. LFS044 TaxID=3229880 RepID=UPI003A7FD037